MKDGIHPQLNPVVFIDTANGAEFATLSTLTSSKTKKIEGVDHFVIMVDISSATHPFFTGKQTLIDTAGRVDKFRARMEAGKKKQEEAMVSKKKREAISKETLEETISRKAKENTIKKEEAKIAEKAEKAKPAKPVKAAKESKEKESSANKKPAAKAKK